MTQKIVLDAFLLNTLRPDGYCVHQWPGRPELNSRSSHTKDSKKLVLCAALLNTQHYKVWIKGKVEQSREKNSAVPYTSV